MQPNKNNFFYLNDKIENSSSALYKKMFKMKIIKSYVEHCGDLFFNEGVPVSITIEIRDIKRRNKYEKEEGYSVGIPRIDNAINLIIEALNGAAYYSPNQIVEVYIVKRLSNERRIKVELSRVWVGYI